ncbi:Zinc finger, DNL-type [Dillenia turbinata]|uniref:Zinc finger, DNL-type n=1 Tax=Dillenia turbinata TaxID=194707 RepID=A0AAN8W068_9MAGN
MEALSSSATIVSSSSSPSLPIFSPKTKLPPRLHRLQISSKNNNNNNNKNNNSEADLLSDSSGLSIVPVFNNRTSLSPLSKDAAMGLVLSAASVRGWTTDSGMEGPSLPAGPESESGTEQVSTFPWSLFTKSPRRRMLVAFTCNLCGQRTTRAINPHAYTDGTVFVQCGGCNVFHKLVDNLNLFHEMKCYVNPSFNYRNGDINFKYLGIDDDSSDDVFPIF